MYLKRTAAAFALASLLFAAPWPTPAEAAETLSPDASVPLPKVIAGQQTVAATGSTFVRQVREATSNRYEFTRDAGATWQPVPDAVANPESLMGVGGSFVGAVLTGVPDEEDPSFVSTALQVWTPGGAVRTLSIPRTDKGGEQLIWDAAGSLAVVQGGAVYDVSGSTAVAKRIAFAPLPVTDGWSKPERLTTNGASIVRYTETVSAGSTRSSVGYLSVAPTNGAPGLAPVKVTNLLDFDVSADTIYYLVGSKTSLKECRAKVATPATRTCRTVTLGNYLAKYGQLQVIGPRRVALVSETDDRTAIWAMTNSAKNRVVRTTTAWWTASPLGDPSWPIVSRRYGTGGPATFKVTSALTLSRLYRPPLTSAPVNLRLTAGRLTGTHEAPYLAGDSPTKSVLWTRSAQGATIGSQVNLYQPARNLETLQASAGRTLTRGFGAGAERQYFYDLNTLVKTRTGSAMLPASELSGPYLQGGSVVTRMDGVKQSSGDAIFGSLVGTWSNGTLSVRDLARPSAAPAKVTPPPATSDSYLDPTIELWGDWAAFGRSQGFDPVVDDVYVVNWRTGEHRTYPGTLLALGDGYVVLRASSDNDDVFVTPIVRVIASGASYTLPTTTAFATDGLGRVVWTDAQRIRFATVPGVGTSAPRLLGVIAPTSFYANGTNKYTPKIDTTESLRAGVLEYRNSAGVVVATVATKAATRGSLRTASWNGRDTAGTLVKAGTYTWTLKAAGLDGKLITSVDGLRAATGTVKVTR